MSQKNGAAMDSMSEQCYTVTEVDKEQSDIKIVDSKNQDTKKQHLVEKKVPTTKGVAGCIELTSYR